MNHLRRSGSWLKLIVEKALVKVSEVTATGDRNAVSSVTSRDERGSLPFCLACHHPRTERKNWFLCAGTVSELTDAGWNITAAPFAGHDEQSPLDDWESECHFPSIGEEEANMREMLASREKE